MRVEGHAQHEANAAHFPKYSNIPGGKKSGAHTPWPYLTPVNAGRPWWWCRGMHKIRANIQYVARRVLWRRPIQKIIVLKGLSHVKWTQTVGCWWRGFRQTTVTWSRVSCMILHFPLVIVLWPVLNAKTLANLASLSHTFFKTKHCIQFQFQFE